MFKACRSLNAEKVSVLLSKGTSPNIRRTCNWTPLHELVHVGLHCPNDKTRMRRIITIIHILLKSGAHINAQDSLGMTPLMMSARNQKNHYIMKYLLRSGANPHVEDFFGRTFSQYITAN